MEYVLVLEQSLNPANAKDFKNQSDIKHLITKAKQTIAKQKAIEISGNNKSEIKYANWYSYILAIFFLFYFLSLI